MDMLTYLKEKEHKAELMQTYYALPKEELENEVFRIKKQLGERLFIPGHHYQKDEVIQFADISGDSLQLAQLSAQNTAASFIVFCGVHFMAETADMLTTKQQKVILPDMRAGCSMADMATLDQTNTCWLTLKDLFGDTVMPLTYVNSTAAIKGFVGKHGGATVTSSNAKKVVSWALQQKQRLLFLPDQHLGRNTAYDLGVSLSEMAVWNQQKNQLEYQGDYQNIKVILWKGFCSVHENFTVDNVENIRAEEPDRFIIVHPECRFEVAQRADYVGSTKYIIDMITEAKPGTSWAIGTEMNLVKRLQKQHPDKNIISLNPYMCPCLTMNRIDLPHLLASLHAVSENRSYHQISVDPETTMWAKQALNKMLILS
ncbi:quinolinate synthase [Amphibacillus cookii]|nr:quinolinate synthase NadA [Amphibacillus cookii]MBM7541763.1 quinolinate synthase [Amphibacillus cookii]